MLMIEAFLPVWRAWMLFCESQRMAPRRRASSFDAARPFARTNGRRHSMETTTTTSRATPSRHERDLERQRRPFDNMGPWHHHRAARSQPRGRDGDQGHPNVYRPSRDTPRAGTAGHRGYDPYGDGSSGDYDNDAYYHNEDDDGDDGQRIIGCTYLQRPDDPYRDERGRMSRYHDRQRRPRGP
jgi:hypothetical protein